jgi:hypothetical protein
MHYCMPLNENIYFFELSMYGIEDFQLKGTQQHYRDQNLVNVSSSVLTLSLLFAHNIQFKIFSFIFLEEPSQNDDVSQ